MAEIKTPFTPEGKKTWAGNPAGKIHPGSISLVWHAAKWRLYLLAASVLLLVLHLLSYFLYFRFPQLGTASLLVQRFGLDRDGNVPTFFSALLLLLSALLLILISHFYRQQKEIRHSRQWLWLGIVFLFLSFDEATQIHEFTSSVIKSINHGPMTGVFRHAWIIPYLVLTLTVVLYYFRFVLALPARTRIQFFVAGGLYVGSALGLEMLEGLEATLHGKSSFLILQLQTVEEMIEMVAIILFNYALMQYLGNTVVAIKLETQPQGAVQSS